MLVFSVLINEIISDLKKIKLLLFTFAVSNSSIRLGKIKSLILKSLIKKTERCQIKTKK